MTPDDDVKKEMEKGYKEMASEEIEMLEDFKHVDNELW